MGQAWLKIEMIEGKTMTEAMVKKPEGEETEFLLAYSPMRCAFAKWNGSEMTDLDGRVFTDTYEVRAFGENFELRWVKDASGEKGRTSILWEIPEGEEYSSLLGEYLLWGTAGEIPQDSDSIVLHEARIGNMRVPKRTIDSRSLGNGSRFSLLFKEYFKPNDTYGNLVFAAERLYGLKVTE
jgi:CRISPR-associated protein (TIGR03984 family)